LADHDGESLARWLAACSSNDTGVTDAGPFGPPEPTVRRRRARQRRIVERVLRHAFRHDARGDAVWSDEALCDSLIGRETRRHLLALSPRVCLTVAGSAPSDDGSERLLLRAHDGALVEAVLIPASAGRDRPRTTLCISSQVGCARACTFCETGAHGLERQLSAGEIVDQYRIAARRCAAHPPADRREGDRGGTPVISNIVFMGMGEPFDNLPEVLRAISLLSDPHAFAFPVSRITVSTVGVADRIAEFYAETRAELAISLNAPDDARRSRIMPVNRRHDLASLRAALLDAQPAGRRVLFQYALFAGFNDALDDADALAAYVCGIHCRVNVIPANPGPDPTLVAPDELLVDAFVARLRARGVSTMLRRPRGRDVGGACGQLAGKRRLELATSPT
jgi:23S rRNA (adenine2503-C2)-methyltransferase